MNQKIIIQKTVDFVKDVLYSAEGEHEWWHIYRVWNLAFMEYFLENFYREWNGEL